MAELLDRFTDEGPAKVRGGPSVKWEYDESPSDRAEMVERGEDVLPAPGRECMSSEVRVLAAFISSTSLNPLALVLGFLAALDLFLVSRFSGLAWDRVRSATEVLVVDLETRERSEEPIARFSADAVLVGLTGAGTGGSSGLRIVLARFAGGGPSNDAKRLCPAEAVIGAGGPMDPFLPREWGEPDWNRLGRWYEVGCEGAWASRSRMLLLERSWVALYEAYPRRARKARVSCMTRMN